ncbi:MAG: imidazole glycerol phosphate synthase subunit HisH [Clostridia bacterium]|nr:imidazole glycerol phosphate synthase subunit HisH [Clostridia bacterium]
MTAIVDYGVGNLFSLRSSLHFLGEDAAVTSDIETLKDADRIILPGGGAFGDAAQKLRSGGLARAVTELASSGKPVLGICLGMQLLFEKSLEFGEHEGLGLIPGTVVPLAGKIDESLKIPHIGWNALEFKKPSVLFKYINNGDYVYFVHSYYASGCGEYVTSVSEYGVDVTASVERGNVYGCQFHPEKSGKVGLAILKAFTETEQTK